MTLTITDLYARRATAWEEAKAFLDERHDAESGCLSAEDDQAYARMEADIEDLTREIARTERAAALEPSSPRPSARP